MEPRVTILTLGVDDLERSLGFYREGLGPPSATEMTIAHNVRSTEEVDALLARAERAGSRIVKPAAETFWGGYAGYFADPDGHLWEIAFNPNMPIDG